LIACHKRLALLWDVDEWKELRRLDLPVDWWGVSFSPDDSQALLAGSMQDGPTTWRAVLRLWDLKDGKEIDRFAQFDAPAIWGAALSPDGSRVLTAGTDGDLRLLDVTTGTVIRQFHGHKSGALSAALSPDGRRALSTGGDGTARLWDVRTGKELAIFRSLAVGALRGVAFSPDGRSALCGGSNGEVWLVCLPPEEETPPKDK
jgi:WD40 repeat protein